MHKEDIIKNAKFYEHFLNKRSVYLKGQTTLTKGPFIIEEIKIEWLDIPKTSYDMRYILRHKYDNKCTISVREGDIILHLDDTEKRGIFNKIPKYNVNDMINSLLYSVPTFYMAKDEFKLPTKEDMNTMFGVSKFEYKKIIFNGPCTIILWKDGTKTIAKASDGEMFDPEKGVAICFMKRALGETEGKKVLRKANKDFYDEVSRIANKQLDEELKKATFPLPKGVTFRPFTFDTPIDNNKVIKVAKEEQNESK